MITTTLAEKTKSSNPPSAALKDAIVEFRYRTNPRILDSRGRIADELRLSMGLDDPRVGHNGLELLSSDNRRKCFVTTTNAGYAAQDTSTEAVADETTKFFRKLTQLKVFRDGSSIPLSRLGARAMMAFPFDGRFEDLRTLIEADFGGPSSRLQATVEAQLEDTAYIYEFKDSESSVSVRCGPMRAEQIVRNFERPDEFKVPDICMYVDVDVHKEPRANSADHQIEAYVRNFAVKADRLARAIGALVISK